MEADCASKVLFATCRLLTLRQLVTVHFFQLDAIKFFVASVLGANKLLLGRGTRSDIARDISPCARPRKF